MFASCVRGTCAAPATGPEPTGPITGTLVPTGTTLELVTDERVRVTLVLPPGAVHASIPITMTAHVPANGSWTGVEVVTTPPGLVLDGAATLSIELPAGFAFPSDTVIAEESGPDVIVAGAPDASGDTITVSTWMLGKQVVMPAARVAEPTTPPSYWDNFLLAALKLTTPELMPVLRMRYNELLAEGRAEDAVGTLAIVYAVLQRRGEPQWESVVTSTFEDMRAGACSALGNAAVTYATPDDCGTAVEAAPELCVHCLFKAKASTVQYLAMVRLQQAIGDAYGEPPCPEAQSWIDTSTKELQKTVRFLSELQTLDPKRKQWLACECTNMDPDTRPQIGCLDKPAQFAAVAQTNDFWAVAVEALARDQHTFAVLGAFDMTSEGDQLDAEFTTADDSSFHAIAWDHCLASRDMSPLVMLGQVAPDPAPGSYFDDAERCASSLELVSLDASSVSVATASVAPPPMAGVGETATSVSVVPGGTLQIRGPIATLICRDNGYAGPTRFEDDVLTLTAQAGANIVTLGTLQANGSTNVLGSVLGFDVDIDSTRSALGLTASNSFELVLERSGPSCGTPMPTELFRLVASAPPRITGLTYAWDCVTSNTGTPVAATLPLDVTLPCAGDIHAVAGDPSTLTVSANWTAASNAWSQLVFDMTLPVPATVTTTANPTWMQSASCGDSIAHFLEYYDTLTDVSFGHGYTGSSVCPNDPYSMYATDTFTVGAGQVVHFRVNHANLSNSSSSMTGSGMSFTIHVTPL